MFSFYPLGVLNVVLEIQETYCVGILLLSCPNLNFTLNLPVTSGVTLLVCILSYSIDDISSVIHIYLSKPIYPAISIYILRSSCSWVYRLLNHRQWTCDNIPGVSQTDEVSNNRLFFVIWVHDLIFRSSEFKCNYIIWLQKSSLFKCSLNTCVFIIFPSLLL